MAIDIGDAVLTFLGDTSQLDETFVKVGAEVPAKLAPAQAGFQGVSDAVQGMSRDMAVGQQGAVELGTVVNLAGETSRESMYQARGEAGLLGEAFGIHLPRHVRSFIAELPGVGVALSAAFQATAILFIISAVIELVQKIQEMAHHAQDVAEAWEKVDAVQRKALDGLEDNLLRAEIKLDDLTGKHLEALRLKLQLIDNTSLSKLAEELDKIAAEADKAFEKMDRNWWQKFVGLEGSEPAKAEFDKLTKSVDKALDARTPQAFAEAMKLVDGQMEKANEELKKLDDQQKAFEANRERASVPGKGIRQQFPAAPDPVTIKAWEELKERIDGYKTAIEEAQKAEQDEKKAAGIEERKRAADAAKKAAEDAFKLYKDIFAARQAMEKELEKQADSDGKLDGERLKQQLKEAEGAAKQKLDLLKQQEEAAIAVLDGEMKAEEDAASRKAELLKVQYDRGLFSGQQYLAKLKELYALEVQSLISVLNRKEQLVILEAQNEAARRGQILSAADAKELKGYIDLENKKKAVQADFDKKFLNAEDQVTKKIAQNYRGLGTLLDDYGKKLRAATTELQGFGAVTNAILTDVSQAFGSAIQQWVLGQESLGKALEKALAQYLAQIAAKAAAEALYWTAYGFAMLAMYDFDAAGKAFTAAGEFAATAGVAGAAAYGLSKAAGGGSSSSAGAASGGSAAASSGGGGSASQSAQNPVQSINVLHLGTGSLVSQSSPVIAANGNNQRGDIYITVEPGMNTKQLVHHISQGVNSGKYRLKASDSLRNTRRGGF